MAPMTAPASSSTGLVCDRGPDAGAVGTFDAAFGAANRHAGLEHGGHRALFGRGEFAAEIQLVRAAIFFVVVADARLAPPQIRRPPVEPEDAAVRVAGIDRDRQQSKNRGAAAKSAEGRPKRARIFVLAWVNSSMLILFSATNAPAAGGYWQVLRMIGIDSIPPGTQRERLSAVPRESRGPLNFLRLRGSVRTIFRFAVESPAAWARSAPEGRRIRCVAVRLVRDPNICCGGFLECARQV